MRVRDVISAAADLAGRGDLAAEAEKPSSEQSEEYKEELTLLLRCFNLVESDLSSDCFPLHAVERLRPENGRIVFSRFSHVPIFIRSVKERGRSLPFREEYAALILPEHTGEVEVTYAFAPTVKTAEDTPEQGGRVTLRVLALGTATEFELARGHVTEAEALERRFRAAIAAAGYPHRMPQLRARRWT